MTYVIIDKKVFGPIPVSIYHSFTIIHHSSIHAGLSFWAEKRRPRIDANRHSLRVSDLIAGTQAKTYFYLADGRFIRDLTEREDSAATILSSLTYYSSHPMSSRQGTVPPPRFRDRYHDSRSRLRRDYFDVSVMRLPFSNTNGSVSLNLCRRKTTGESGTC